MFWYHQRHHSYAGAWDPIYMFLSLRALGTGFPHCLASRRAISLSISCARAVLGSQEPRLEDVFCSDATHPAVALREVKECQLSTLSIWLSPLPSSVALDRGGLCLAHSYVGWTISLGTCDRLSHAICCSRSLARGQSLPPLGFLVQQWQAQTCQ